MQTQPQAAPTFSLTGLSAGDVNLILAGLDSKAQEVSALVKSIHTEANAQAQAFAQQQANAQAAAQTAAAGTDMPSDTNVAATEAPHA